MGGGGDTKKTLAQVQQELLETLCTNANKWANPPIQISNPASVDDLEKILAAASREAFKGYYGYDFQNSLTTPPTMIPGTIFYALENFCNITTNEGKQIENYVEEQILGATQIKDIWIYNQASADIGTEGKALFEMAPGNNWFIQPLGPNVYNSLKTTQNSYRLDAEIMYCNADLTIDGNTGRYTFLYFIGVAYEVTSPQKAVLNDLLGILAKNANDLLAGVGLDTQPLSPTPGIQDIEKILNTFCLQQFQTDNGFAFNNDLTTPPDIAPGTKAYGTGAVFYPSNHHWQKNLTTFAQISILNAMNLQSWANGPASKALTNELTGLLGQTTGNNWLQASFNGSYDTANVMENLYQTNAVLAYTNASLTQEDVTVNVSLVYYMGVYYQMQSPFIAAEQAVVKQLCTTANELLQTPVPIGPPPFQEYLSTILGKYARDQFSSRYGFPYEGGATKPTDAASPYSPMVSNENLLYILNDDTSKLTNAINGQILAGIDIPQWALNDTRSGLYQELVDLSNQSKVNIWDAVQFTPLYPNPFDRNANANTIKSTAVIVYSDATGVYGGQQYTATFFYYLGVYYLTPANPWGE